MSLEAKVGFLLISDIRMKNEAGRQAPSSGPVTGEFNETDVVRKQYLHRTAASRTSDECCRYDKGVNEFQLRHFIYRGNVRRL